MFQVYTEKKGDSFSKTMIGEYRDLNTAYDKAESLIDGKPDLKYIIEETTGSFNSYGERLTRVIADSEDSE